MNRRSLGYLIALSALLISIPRYVATFAGIDAVPLTAYGMGILLAGGAAYIVDAWADATKRGVKRTGSLLAVLTVNLAYEPVLLTPFVLSRLWSVPLADVMSPAYAVFWSVMVTLAPVLLVFGVVYAVWFHKQPDATKAQSTQVTDTSPQVPAFLSAKEHAVWLHERNPELTPTQLAQRVGCSVSTASRAISKNGNGDLTNSA